MSKIGIFMADGCEEIEGLTVVDVVRRAKMEIVMLSITGKKEVTSSHGVTFLADALAEETGYEDLDGIVLPGGMPGTMHLLENETVNAVIRKFAEEGKLVAAICAAPSVLVDGNIITSRGMGTAIPFAFEIVRYFTDDETVEHVRQGLVYRANEK